METLPTFRCERTLSSMCGRFALDEKTDVLIREFVAAGGDFRDWRPGFSFAPTQTVVVVREREHDGELVRLVEGARWDFWPEWMDAGKHTRPLFNTRIETAATNGLWKRAFASSRCIVPMRGYFEWTGEKGAKQPHFLHGSGVLAAAGIYTPRKDEHGDWYLTCSIITREARDASGEVHDRMPAFLTPDLWDEWLTPVKVEDPEELVQTLQAVSEGVASSIESYMVDPRVNNHRKVDPADSSLIDPLESS